LLLNGKPGVGKSLLVQYVRQLLGCQDWCTYKFNGTQVKIEVIENLANRFTGSNLYDNYDLVWIDEADEIPRVAQVRFLTLLDDLRPGVAVICTSNCQLKNFENRFQTRFQVMELTPPPSTEIEKLIVRLAPDIVQKDAKEITMRLAETCDKRCLILRACCKRQRRLFLPFNFRPTRLLCRSNFRSRRRAHLAPFLFWHSSGGSRSRTKDFIQLPFERL